jgi:hypothetical protein
MPGIRSCNHKDCVNPDHVGKAKQTCAEAECDNSPYSQGICSRHFYSNRKEHGRPINKQDLLAEIIETWDATNEPPGNCAYEDCQRPYKAKGLCMTHYMSHFQYQRRLAKRQSADLQ